MGLLFWYRPNLLTASLPVAIALQYAVSLLHHWRPHTVFRSRLDRSVIFAVIGATYVPYWGNLLPLEEGWLRLPWVGAVTLIGCALVFLGTSNRIIGVLWAGFASAGLLISFYELQEWLPPIALLWFWIGSTLYGLQQLVYFLKLPNPFPDVYGYREVQHSLLFVATTIGCVVALQYT